MYKVVGKENTMLFNNLGKWNHTKPEDLSPIIQKLVKRVFDDRMVTTMDLLDNPNKRFAM